MWRIKTTIGSDEVLQQYKETLCTAQKKSTFMNTLLQDILQW